MEADSSLRGLLRHIGTIIGALLVRKGYIDSGSIEFVSGLIIAGGMMLWSLYSKKQASKTIDHALDLPSGSTREELKAVVVTTEAQKP